jgi:monoamine oxidase
LSALVAGAIPAAPAFGRAQGPDVAIVGAGIAGLSAALVLRDRGLEADVYEAQQRVGGRMHSETALWNDGQVSEYGAELIDSDHTVIQALAKRFGLPLADILAAEGASEQQTIFQHGRYYAQDELYQEFRPVYRVLAKHVAEAGTATTYAHSTAVGRELDRMSLTEYIERFVPGGMRSDVGTFIYLQYVAEYGIDAEAQSSLNMVYWLGRQPQYDERTGAFVALGPSDQRYHIEGGNARLPRAIAAGLPAERLHLGHRLERIRRRPDGRIELTFDHGGARSTRVVDKAIVTLPFSVLRGIDIAEAGFDARKLAAIEELAYGDHSKLIVQFDDRYWNERGPWPGRSTGDITYDGPFMQTWDASRAQPGKSGLIVNYAAAYQSAALHPSAPYTTSLTPRTAAYGSSFVRELDAVWPGASKRFSGKVALSHVKADPFARGSYAGWLRGQYTRFGGYERVRQGNVLFAGEHCSVLLQGFMEGAAREGMRAAHEVLQDAGVHAVA